MYDKCDWGVKAVLLSMRLLSGCDHLQRVHDRKFRKNRSETEGQEVQWVEKYIRKRNARERERLGLSKEGDLD